MVLIIVDPQYDFVIGNLSIKGSRKAIDHIASFIEQNDINKCYITVDWHPYNHCSFKSEGGIWDKHCIKYTYGASIIYSIISALGEKKITPDIIRKGEYHEEYTAFTNTGLINVFGEKFWEIEKSSCRFNILIPENEDVVICGLNGVLETIKALIDLNPIIMLDGIASIDDGEELNNYIHENNLRTI